ncbi:MAG: hypothetical protein U1D29_09790 [Burkholderiales bacterium]|nr:hypothetical protein [Burkholderiales bacterium]
MSAPLCLRSPVLFSSAPSAGWSQRPDVWSAQSLGRADAPTVPTGHAALDAQLPGGGWPVGALVEILQAPPGWQTWSLLLPALVQVLASQPGPVVLVGAPVAPGGGSGRADDGLVPFGPSLRAQGLAPERLLWVCAGPSQAKPAPRGGSEPHEVGSMGATGRCAGPSQAKPTPEGLRAAAPGLPAQGRTTRRDADSGSVSSSEPHEVGSVGATGRRAGPAAARLWATEQALRCADVAAVLAWLPQADSSALRRLQLAAQMHGRLLFVFRPQAAQHEASPARLRLRVGQAEGPLQAGPTAPESVGALQVHILKRRGPPLEDPLTLTPQPPRLMALLAARRREPGSRALQAPPPSRGAGWVEADRQSVEGAHALDRVAVAAG